MTYQIDVLSLQDRIAVLQGTPVDEIEDIMEAMCELWDLEEELTNTLLYYRDSQNFFSDVDTDPDDIVALKPARVCRYPTKKQCRTPRSWKAWRGTQYRRGR
jgi:hypothetical protein